MMWKGQADAHTQLMINKIISLATATEKDCCEGVASNRVYKLLHCRCAVCLIAVFFSTFLCLFTDICLTGDLTNQQLHFYEMVSLHFTGENLIYKLKDVFFVFWQPQFHEGSITFSAICVPIHGKYFS